MAKIKKEIKDRNYLRLRPDRNLSNLSIAQAESDEHLPAYYIGKERFVARALDRSDRASVFIGPKGVGKSAILEMVRCEQRHDSRRLIDISPDDLAFNVLMDLEHTPGVLSDPYSHQYMFKALWDFVLLVEIFRIEFSERRSLTDLLARMLPGQQWQRDAKRLVDISYHQSEGSGTFTSRMLKIIEEIELSAKIGTPSSAGGVAATAKLREGNDPIKSMSLLALLNRVAKEITARLHNEYYVLIDDLDLYWTNAPIQNSFLAALFDSMRRLSRSRRIKFVVSLRDNIFRQIQLEESDKYNDLVCSVRWQQAEIKQMVEKRIAYTVDCPEQQIWSNAFKVNAFNYIWEHSSRRPRDILRAVRLCIEAAIEEGQKSVTGLYLEKGVRAYSRETIKDWASEHRHSFRGLADIANWFKGRSPEFKIDVIQEMAFELEDVIQSNNANKPQCDWIMGYFEDPWGLARILVNLGFLLVKDSRNASARLYIPDEDDISSIQWFAIHPRFRMGLSTKGASK